MQSFSNVSTYSTVFIDWPESFHSNITNMTAAKQNLARKKRNCTCRRIFQATFFRKWLKQSNLYKVSTIQLLNQTANLNKEKRTFHAINLTWCKIVNDLSWTTLNANTRTKIIYLKIKKLAVSAKYDCLTTIIPCNLNHIYLKTQIY